MLKSKHRLSGFGNLERCGGIVDTSIRDSLIARIAADTGLVANALSSMSGKPEHRFHEAHHFVLQKKLRNTQLKH